jgi:hypothetical protein
MTIKPRTSSETVLLVRESVAGMILEVKDACLSRLIEPDASRCRLAWGYGIYGLMERERERYATTIKGTC